MRWRCRHRHDALGTRYFSFILPNKTELELVADRPLQFEQARRLMVHSAYEDTVNTAQIVRASDYDWTIVRVSVLTDAPKTGRMKVGHVNQAMGTHLARADMAEFMLKQVQDTTYLRQAPAIAIEESLGFRDHIDE